MTLVDQLLIPPDHLDTVRFNAHQSKLQTRARIYPTMDLKNSEYQIWNFFKPAPAGATQSDPPASRTSYISGHVRRRESDRDLTALTLALGQSAGLLGSIQNCPRHLPCL